MISIVAGGHTSSMALYVILWVVCYLKLFETSVEVNVCLDKCQCYYQPDGGLKLQCDNRNYINFILVSDVPENSKVISFKNNRIQKLTSQPVEHAKSTVWHIDLSSNDIEGIMEDHLGKAFPNLSHLDLAYNKIRFLSSNSFQHLAKLTVLYLSYNNLRILNLEWFSYILELSHLYIKHNKIKYVNIAWTGWPTKLSTLDLSHNELKIIPPLPLKAQRVNLTHNPIYCGCHLDVNKEVLETFITVECSFVKPHFQPADMPERGTKLVKYRSEGPKCQPVTISSFSYSEDKGKPTISCNTTYGYPDVTIHVYYEESKIMTSQLNVTLVVKSPGMYTCKVTNYISFDQQKLSISFDHEIISTTMVIQEMVNASGIEVVTFPPGTGQPTTGEPLGRYFNHQIVLTEPKSL